MNNSNTPAKVILLSTGGTIEKTYDERGGLLENRRSIILEKIVAKLRLPYTDLAVESIMAKDSLYMTDEDRELIAKTIADRLNLGCPIIVIHGTDTMELTARHCHERVANPAQPVIFTGAMRPLEFENTDAIQNVTEALMAARIVSPGFYISFHSRLFPVPQVGKNHDLGTFEAK